MAAPCCCGLIITLMVLVVIEEKEYKRINISLYCCRCECECLEAEVIMFLLKLFDIGLKFEIVDNTVMYLDFKLIWCFFCHLI